MPSRPNSTASSAVTKRSSNQLTPTTSPFPLTGATGHPPSGPPPPLANSMQTPPPLTSTAPQLAQPPQMTSTGVNQGSILMHSGQSTPKMPQSQTPATIPGGVIGAAPPQQSPVPIVTHSQPVNQSGSKSELTFMPSTTNHSLPSLQRTCNSSTNHQKIKSLKS